MADTIIFTPQRGWTLNGDVLPGGKALFFQTGTSTPVVVYSDAALSAVLSQPVLADSNGVFPQVYFDGTTNVRAVVRSSDDVEVSDIDPVATVALSSSGAAGITFAPSVNVPASDVQDAVELVDTNWRATTAAQQAELDGLGTASLMDDSEDTDLSNDPDAAARRDIVKAAIDASATATQALLLGEGQTWQDVSGSRVRGTSYQNTTGRTIAASLLHDGAGVEASADNSTWVSLAVLDYGSSYCLIIPDQWYYRMTGSGAPTLWAELR